MANLDIFGLTEKKKRNSPAEEPVTETPEAADDWTVFGPLGIRSASRTTKKKEE